MKRRNEAENKWKSANKVSVKEIYISRQDDNSEVVMGFLGVYLYKGLLPKNVLIDKPHCGIHETAT